jgi:hypothetical protein
MKNRLYKSDKNSWVTQIVAVWASLGELRARTELQIAAPGSGILSLSVLRGL